MSVLEAAKLGVRTAAGRRLLQGVDLAVEPGETVLLCGRPGSGKTLLSKALCGLLDGREDLLVEGDVRRSGTVGIVFQRPEAQLVRSTVRRDVAFGLENLGLPRAEMTDRIATYARALDAEHLLDRDTDALSHGEAALVALLGVLVTEPDAVVLDEPLAALDGRNAAVVIEAIDRLRGADVAVVIAEHDLRDLLGRADRALLLRGGRVRRRGPPADLAADLRDEGLDLPVETAVALALGERGDDGAVPMAGDGPGG